MEGDGIRSKAHHLLTWMDVYTTFCEHLHFPSPGLALRKNSMLEIPNFQAPPRPTESWLPAKNTFFKKNYLFLISFY